MRPVEQTWIEHSLDWLLTEFGEQRLRATVLLPTEEHFPGAYEGTTGDVETLVYRLCRHMGVDPARIEVEHGEPDHDPGLAAHVPLHTSWQGAAGHFRTRAGRAVLAIRTDLTARPMALVATVAHELGHVLLLGDGRISPAREDHEALTDLLTVFFGLGIFSANAAFDHRREVRGGYAYTSRTRLGYLTEPMYGYALARYAWLRDEPHPPWATHLDANPRAFLKRGLRYLSAVRPPTGPGTPGRG
ncbi:hypothetical protein GCM10010170_055690 [Dactylosporangium salmoneum]|uniref:Uncharacterized protein n=1 Tax=Dactylosporangium salmoneum TaxID=53361 RepID=A0ABP5TU94_9ACTN